MDNVKAKNCFISAWDIDGDTIAETLNKLSKTRCIVFATNQELKMVEMLVSFQEQVYTKSLYDTLSQQGAGSPTIVTFGLDWLNSAASALVRIRRRPAGWIHGSKGELDAKLLAKVEALEKEEDTRLEETEFSAKEAAAVQASLKDLSHGIHALQERMIDKDDIRGLVEENMSNRRLLERALEEEQRTTADLRQVLSGDQVGELMQVRSSLSQALEENVQLKTRMAVLEKSIVVLENEKSALVSAAVQQAADSAKDKSAALQQNAALIAAQANLQADHKALIQAMQSEHATVVADKDTLIARLQSEKSVISEQLNKQQISMQKLQAVHKETFEISERRRYKLGELGGIERQLAEAQCKIQILENDKLSAGMSMNSLLMQLEGQKELANVYRLQAENKAKEIVCSDMRKRAREADGDEHGDLK